MLLSLSLSLSLSLCPPLSFTYSHFHRNLQYRGVESAVATRARLHGLKWPSTNSKFLSVDYLTPEDVARISEGQLEVKPFLEAIETSEGDRQGEAPIEMETNASTEEQGNVNFWEE